MPVYDCRDLPTIQDFFDSDAFIRGLMGPFGCLPGDTEFLTPLGWKRIDAYTPGDRLMQWSSYGGAIWTEPVRYVVAPATEFIHFDAPGLKMALTPDHRVPHWNYVGEFRVTTAGTMAQTSTRHTIPTVFETPSQGIDLSDARIRFSVMMQADGSYPKGGKQAVVAVRKPRKKERIRQILSDLGIKWDERVYEARPTESSFVFYPPDRQKHFPAEWYGMSAYQLRVVLDELPHWDGLFGTEERRFFSTHKSDADFVQFAAHATGFRATIRRTDYKDEKWKTAYRVHIRTSDSHKNKAAVRGHTERRVEPAPDGLSYCFEVPSGFFVARYKDTVFITGNSGKSSACVMEVAQRGIAQTPGPDGVRRSRWAVIRNTAKQLEDTTERTFLQWFPPHQFGDWTPSKHNYTIRALKAPGDDRSAEIEVNFRALDRVDQLGDLLSAEYTGGWVNEGREVPWAVIDSLTGRVGRYPARKDGGASWSGIWLDTNPPDVDSEWFRFFEEQDHSEAVEKLATVPGFEGMTIDKYRKLFRQPSGMSPKAENLANLPPGYYERQAIGKSPEWVKIYVNGEYGFVMDGRAVWPEYVDELHCPAKKENWPKPIPSLPIIRGWDSSGLTPACVFTQITPRGQWIVFDEIVSKRMGAQGIADEVNDRAARNYPGFEFQDVGDPAGMSVGPTDMRTYFQVLHASGIAIEPALQTLEIRLESVRKPLRSLIDGRPQFVLHPRCKDLRRALLGGYHYRKIKVSGERYTNTPDKNAFSHVADALGYAGTRVFGTGILMPRSSGADRQREYETVGGNRRSSTGY